MSSPSIEKQPLFPCVPHTASGVANTAFTLMLVSVSVFATMMFMQQDPNISSFLYPSCVVAFATSGIFFLGAILSSCKTAVPIQAIQGV